MEEFGASLLFVVLAELGDKTQLLAMAFATRYRWQTVMWGVFAATVLNHLFAVAAGAYITRFIPLSYVQIIAAASFIVFGLWTIRGDQLTCEDRERCMSPFWTVATAFFLAEMGDKTQLATMTLAAKYAAIVPVWLGTTTGMTIADALGIVIGVVMGKQIPERAVKWFAALIFIFFGLYGLNAVLPKEIITLPVTGATLVLIGVLMYLVDKWGDGEKSDGELE